MVRMDVAAACAAFVSVAEHESFSRGADVLGIPQSVASRRVAALEAFLGGALLTRTTKRVSLTVLGREILTQATDLATGPAALAALAAEVRARPVLFAFPALCHPVDLARATIACRSLGEEIASHVAPPITRARLLAEGYVTYSLEPAPPDEATWSIPLGVLSREPAPHGIRHLDSLRPSRSDRGRRSTLWVHPEDDVPHVRDRLATLRNSLGLSPSQVRTARNLPDALVRILASEDLLLGSPRQAHDLNLEWSEIAELYLTRGYRLASQDVEAAGALVERCGEAIGVCIGARPSRSVQESRNT